MGLLLIHCKCNEEYDFWSKEVQVPHKFYLARNNQVWLMKYPQAITLVAWAQGNM